MKRKPIQEIKHRNDDDCVTRFIRDAEIVHDSEGRNEERYSALQNL
jgi:hypothetical protein